MHSYITSLTLLEQWNNVKWSVPATGNSTRKDTQNTLPAAFTPISASFKCSVPKWQKPKEYEGKDIHKRKVKTAYISVFGGKSQLNKLEICIINTTSSDTTFSKKQKTIYMHISWLVITLQR